MKAWNCVNGIVIVGADELLREFARKCALQVVHLWNAPEVVREYLETGREGLRLPARAAAKAAAWSMPVWPAASGAARDAAENAMQDSPQMAAWDAAICSAGATAWDAAGARGAAWDAAWATARNAQSEKLEQIAKTSAATAAPVGRVNDSHDASIIYVLSMPLNGHYVVVEVNAEDQTAHIFTLKDGCCFGEYLAEGDLRQNGYRYG